MNIIITTAIGICTIGGIGAFAVVWFAREKKCGICIMCHKKVMACQSSMHAEPCHEWCETYY